MSITATPGEEPAVEMASVECTAGRGLRGDRFFDYKEDYKGQITFFAWEVYEDLCRQFKTQLSGRRGLWHRGELLRVDLRHFSATGLKNNYNVAKPIRVRPAA